MESVISYIVESKLNKKTINSVSGFKKLIHDKLNNLIEEKESEVLDLSGLEFNINDLSGAFEVIGQQPEDLRYLEKIDVSNWKFNKPNIILDDIFAFKPYHKFDKSLSDEEFERGEHFGYDDIDNRRNRQSVRREIKRSRYTDKSDAYLAKIEIIGLDTWDVSKVTSMNRIFYGFESKIDKNALANWNISKVKSLNEAFAFCNMDINISNWNLSNVTSAKRLFTNSNFIGDISKWDVSKVRDMSEMFAYAKNIPDISKWNVSNVTNMSRMFIESSIADINLSNWNTQNVRDFSEMFRNCKEFNGDLSNWIIKDANCDYMFEDCREFTGKGVETWKPTFNPNFEKSYGRFNNFVVKHNHYMFGTCAKFNADISNWDASKIIALDYTFYNCVSLNFDISKWKLTGLFDPKDYEDMNVYSLHGSFKNCNNLGDESITRETLGIPEDMEIRYPFADTKITKIK